MWRPALLAGLLALSLAVLFFARDAGRWQWRHTVGAFILIPSIACFLAARWALGSSFTARAEARVLVTHGIYRWVRHPIYISAELIMIGVIIFLGAYYVLLVVLVSFPLQLVRAHREERILEAAFGAKYRAYRARTLF
jgi:protein-S-isoprenylcysteine O-methyltransferase Ste14